MLKRYYEQVLNDGVDQSAEELVAMGGLDKLINGEFRREGGITRRKGFESPTNEAVAADSVAEAGHTLVTNGAALAVLRKMDAVNVDAVSDGVNEAARSFVLPGTVSTAAQLRDASGFCNASVAVGVVNGVLCACVVGQLAGAEDANTVWRAVVVEVDTGAMLNFAIVVGQRPVPIFVESAGNERFHVVYRTNSAAEIRTMYWDAATNAWSSAISLLNGEVASTATYPAVCADPDNAARYYVAFADTAETEIHVRRVNFDGTISASYGINVTEVQHVAITHSLRPTGHLHLAYSLDNGASVRIISNQAGGGTVTAEQVVLTRSTAGYRWRHLSIEDIGDTGASTYNLVVAGCETTGTFTFGNVRHRNVSYVLAGSPLMPTYTTGTEQVAENLYLLANIAQLHPDDLAEPVAGISATPALFMSRVTDVPGTASRLTTTHSFMTVLPHQSNYWHAPTLGAVARLGATMLPGSAYNGAADDTNATYELARPSRVVYDATSRSYFVAALDIEEAPTAGSIIYGIRVLRYSFSTVRSSAQPLPVAQLGDLTYIGGSLLRCYDGHNVTEASPFHPPSAPTLAETTGGSLDLTATYTVQAVLLFEDAKGRVHRSAPSPAQQFELTGANNALTATFDLDVFPHTRASYDAVRLEVYRSEGDGTTLYLDQTVDVLEGTGNTVVTITQADAAVNTNKTIYTTGDVLESESPPPAKALAAVGNRLFGINAVDPRSIFFSKELEEGFAAEFNPVLSFRLEASKSEPVALGVLGDLLVIFTREEAWAISTHGGPDALGAGTFGLPQRLSSDCGASSPEAAVSTPFGVLVHGPFGFRLLQSGGGALDVPAVADIASNGSVIARSVHVPEREECWFLVRDDATTNRVVVFSYARGKIRWGTHEIAGTPAVSIRDIANVRGRVWLLAETGTSGANGYVLRRQSLTSYSDAGTRPTLTARTRWFKPEGHMGDSRFWNLHVLATHGARDALEADVYLLDTSSVPADDLASTDFLAGTYSWPEDTLASDDRLVHVRQRLAKQRGAGVRVELRLVDDGGAATEPGPVLHVVGWDYGVSGGSAHRGATFGAEQNGGS